MQNWRNFPTWSDGCWLYRGCRSYAWLPWALPHWVSCMQIMKRTYVLSIGKSRRRLLLLGFCDRFPRTESKVLDSHTAGFCTREPTKTAHRSEPIVATNFYCAYLVQRYTTYGFLKNNLRSVIKKSRMPRVLSLAPPTACWCYGMASSTSRLNTDLAVAPLSLATPGILAL